MLFIHLFFFPKSVYNVVICIAVYYNRKINDTSLRMSTRCHKLRLVGSGLLTAHTLYRKTYIQMVSLTNELIVMWGRVREDLEMCSKTF